MKLHVIHDRANNRIDIHYSPATGQGEEGLLTVEHPDPATAMTLAKTAAAGILVGRSCLDLRIYNKPEEFQ